MSLEAIAALLGHSSLSMTLTYARIADRTVAEEYFAVSQQVEALYDAETCFPPTRKDPTWGGSRGDHPPTTRQRALHPAGRTRLPLQDNLRNLQPLLHQRIRDHRQAQPTDANATAHQPPDGSTSRSSPHSDRAGLDTDHPHKPRLLKGNHSSSAVRGSRVPVPAAGPAPTAEAAARRRRASRGRPAPSYRAKVSLIPSSRATSAIGRDVSTTIRAASSRNSGVNFRYFPAT